MLKVYDYTCEKCGASEIDKIAEKGSVVSCEKCGHVMTQLFPCPRGGEARGRFQPFYSDTFEMPVKDREDLKKLKDLRKEAGLECIGHRRTQRDTKAIRYNYES